MIFKNYTVNVSVFLLYLGIESEKKLTLIILTI